MVVGNGEADTFIPGVEATVGGLHNDFWGLGWVLLRADNFTHVEATLVLLVVKAEDNVVPGVDVLWVWQADEAIIDLSSLLDLGLDVLNGHLSLSLKSHLSSLVSFLHFASCLEKCFLSLLVIKYGDERTAFIIRQTLKKYTNIIISQFFFDSFSTRIAWDQSNAV